MPKGNKLQDLIIKIDSKFGDIPNQHSGGASIVWTPEQDLTLLMHYERSNKGQFIKRFREVYKHGSDKSMRRRFKYLQSLFKSVDEYEPDKVKSVTPH